MNHADIIAIMDERDGLRAEIAAERKRADQAEQERDHNLLISGDINCLETDKPGCGYCHYCLSAQRDAAVERADLAEAGADALRVKVDYYAERPDSRCGGEGCVTVLQLHDAIQLDTDAGLAFLERLRAAESRVEVESGAYETCANERDEARAALDKARRDCDTMIAVHDEVEKERDALKEECARLKAEVETLCKHSVGRPQVSHDYPRVRIARLERDRYKAALGRAVAALQVVNQPHGTPTQRTEWLREVRTILADPTCAAAGEAWAAAVEYADALAQADCGEGKPSDMDVYRGRFEVALAKVAARRGK